MTVNLLVVMDDIAGIKAGKDSSIAMLWAAARRGWTLWYAEQDDLYVRDGAACGRLRPLQVFESLECWHEFGEAVDRPLAEMQVILMRKDPPFDMRFIYTTYILERAEEAGVLVVNKPQSLRDCNEKFLRPSFRSAWPRHWWRRTWRASARSLPNTATSSSSRWTAWAGPVFSVCSRAV